MQNAWKTLGVEVTLRTEPSRTLFGQTTKHRAFPGLVMYTWTSLVGESPRLTLGSGMVPSEANNWSGANFTGFSDPEFDKAVDIAETELDPGKRRAAWAAMQRIYAERLPALPLFVTVIPQAMPPWLRGFGPSFGGASHDRPRAAGARPRGAAPAGWSRWLDANPDLAGALAVQAPFGNGTMSLYARGQVVRDYRGVRTVGHGGLWPGYRTEFLRAPSEDVAVIVIANRADADPLLLAHQVLDLLLDARPGAAPAPMRANPEVTRPLAGRWLDPATAATLDIAVTQDGATSFTAYGLPFEPSTLPDGRLGTVRGMSRFALRPVDADTIEVELDAGHIATFLRVPPNAALPDGLPGSYCNDEMDAAWTIEAEAGGLQILARGPVTRGGPWRIEPVKGDVVRIPTPDLLFASWLDAQALRNGAGAVTGLMVNGGRVKDVPYRRLAG